MKVGPIPCCCVLLSLVMIAATSVLAAPPADDNSQFDTSKADKTTPQSEADETSAADLNEAPARKLQRMPLPLARQQAELMSAIYVSTLDVMHHRYFHGGRSIVPARAMEDIFDELQQQSDIEARWISVNLKPMSIHHKPKTDFEKRAAAEIEQGKPSVDTVEDGYYRRATAISMSGGCIGCHDGFFKKPNSKAKFTGLVISIPVLKAKPSHRSNQQ